jgi:hypothetical protein
MSLLTVAPHGPGLKSVDADSRPVRIDMTGQKQTGSVSASNPSTFAVDHPPMVQGTSPSLEVFPGNGECQGGPQ